MDVHFKLSIVITMLLCLMLITAPVLAEETTTISDAWIDYIGDDAFTDENISYDAVTDTFTIHNAVGLAWVAKDINTVSENISKTFVLDNDINLQGHEWIPIGIDSNEWFKGTFNGAGHTISNLTIIDSDEPCVGMFGTIWNANITDVTLDNVNINGICTSGEEPGTGGLVGFVGADEGEIITIENCKISGIVTNDDESHVGGLIGYCWVSENSNVIIKKCSVSGDVNGGGVKVGGLIGFVENYDIDTTITITDCVVSGNVRGGYGKTGSSSETDVGGLIGYCWVNDNGNVVISDNTILLDSITVTGWVAGGLVGRVNTYGSAVTVTIKDNTVLTQDMTVTESPYENLNSASIDVGYIQEGSGETTQTQISDNIIPQGNSYPSITENNEGVITTPAEEIYNTVLEECPSVTEDMMPDYTLTLYNSTDRTKQIIVKKSIGTKYTLPDISEPSFLGWADVNSLYQIAYHNEQIVTIGDNKELWAIYNIPYDVTITQPEHANIIINTPADSHVFAGDTVKVSITPAAGYMFQGVWDVSANGEQIPIIKDGKTAWFTMPASDVMITAKVNIIPTAEPTPNVFAGGHTELSEKPDTFMVDLDENDTIPPSTNGEGYDQNTEQITRTYTISEPNLVIDIEDSPIVKQVIFESGSSGSLNVIQNVYGNKWSIWSTKDVYKFDLSTDGAIMGVITIKFDLDAHDISAISTTPDDVCMRHYNNGVWEVLPIHYTMDEFGKIIHYTVTTTSMSPFEIYFESGCVAPSTVTTELPTEMPTYEPVITPTEYIPTEMPTYVNPQPLPEKGGIPILVIIIPAIILAVGLTIAYIVKRRHSDGEDWEKL